MEKASLLRKIPSVDEVLRRPEVQALAAQAAPALLACWTREALDGARQRVLEGEIDESRMERNAIHEAF